MKLITKLLAAATIAVTTAGCASDPYYAQGCGPNYGGAIVGGVAGGLVGSQVGRGSGRTAATAVGAGTGAVIGSQVGCP
jgi:outer membrane lipoprotein SlyB